MLHRLVETAATDVRVRRIEADVAVQPRYSVARYAARSWRSQRRVSARIEARVQGLDIRYEVSKLEGGAAQWLYETHYRARG